MRRNTVFLDGLNIIKIAVTPKLEMCKTYKLIKRKFCVCVLKLTENSNFLKAERGETSKVFFFFLRAMRGHFWSRHTI